MKFKRVELLHGDKITGVYKVYPEGAPIEYEFDDNSVYELVSFKVHSRRGRFYVYIIERRMGYVDDFSDVIRIGNETDIQGIKNSIIKEVKKYAFERSFNIKK